MHTVIAGGRKSDHNPPDENNEWGKKIYIYCAILDFVRNTAILVGYSNTPFQAPHSDT